MMGIEINFFPCAYLLFFSFIKQDDSLSFFFEGFSIAIASFGESVKECRGFCMAGWSRAMFFDYP